MPFPTIDDFVPEVRFELGGRTDIDDRIKEWIRDAYREVGMGYPLETLEISTQNLTVGGIDTYDYPENCRAIKSLVLMNSQNNPNFPTPVTLTKKNIQVVRMYQVGITGVPSIWAPFNTQFLLRTTPNDSYPLFIDFWQKPVISDTIGDTEIMVPEDWYEVVKFEAVQRGHLKLNEPDKAQAVLQQLHGDPDSQHGWPGLIKERMTRNAAENSVSNFGLRPRIRPYGRSR